MEGSFIDDESSSGNGGINNHGSDIMSLSTNGTKLRGWHYNGDNGKDGTMGDLHCCMSCFQSELWATQGSTRVKARHI